MTIDVLPPSPNGELSHDDVRLKLNEAITAFNSLSDTALLTVTSDATLTGDGTVSNPLSVVGGGGGGGLPSWAGLSRDIVAGAIMPVIGGGIWLIVDEDISTNPVFNLFKASSSTTLTQSSSGVVQASAVQTVNISYNMTFTTDAPTSLTETQIFINEVDMVASRSALTTGPAGESHSLSGSIEGVVLAVNDTIDLRMRSASATNMVLFNPNIKIEVVEAV